MKCNECNENRIICKNIHKSSQFKSDVIPLNTLIRTKLFLAVKYEFYMCEITNIEDNQEQIRRILKSRNIPINDNPWYISCDYDGRNYYNNHFRCGWCIVHYMDGIVYDSVGLVS